MKIIETDDQVLKGYLDQEDDTIYLEFEQRAYHFTPLETVQLRDLLSTLIDKTRYFKGLRQERVND